MPFLEWLQGGRTKGRLELREGAALRLGRGSDADGRVDGDPYMSRLHVVVTLEGAGLRVRRLPTATNAVLHGGVEKEEFRLEPGESFVVGATRFRFADQASGTVPPALASTLSSESAAPPTTTRPAAVPADGAAVSDRKRLEHALERFFPRRTVASLLAADDLRALEPKLADCTVLFFRVHGFSQLAEPGDAELEIFKKLRAVLDAATDEIFKEEGAVLQHLGDGMIAAWNAPHPQAGHADRACRAALALTRRLAEIDPALRGGVGLQTGRVAAGAVGAAPAFAYGLVGPAADQAARVESAAELVGVPILAARPVARLLTPGSGAAATPLGFFRPAGGAADLELCEISPGPVDPRRLAAFEAFETAFAAGAWNDAAAALKGRPESDAAAHALSRLARKYAAAPPANWRGVVDLSEP